MVEHQCHVILSKLPCRFTFNYRSSELEWSTFAVALDLKRKLATKSCIASFLDPNLDPKTGRYKISPPLKFTAPASTFKPCSTCVSCSGGFFPRRVPSSSSSSSSSSSRIVVVVPPSQVAGLIDADRSIESWISRSAKFVHPGPWPARSRRSPSSGLLLRSRI